MRSSLLAMVLCAAVPTATLATLLITSAPRVGGPTVDLVHERQTSLGNQAITDTVSNSTFVVTGMSGGAAGDCSAVTGCVTSGDCSSGVCTGSSCQ